MFLQRSNKTFKWHQSKVEASHVCTLWSKIIFMQSIWSELNVEDTSMTHSKYNYASSSYDVSHLYSLKYTFTHITIFRFKLFRYFSKPHLNCLHDLLRITRNQFSEVFSFKNNVIYSGITLPLTCVHLNVFLDGKLGTHIFTITFTTLYVCWYLRYHF